MEFDENLNPINQNNEPDWSQTPPPPNPPLDDIGPISQPPAIEPTPTPPPPPPEPPQFQPALTLAEEPRSTSFNAPVLGLMVATVLLAAVAITAIAVGNSQQPVVLPGDSAGEHGLQVTGSGRAYATPDVAKINFGVETKAKNIADAQEQNSKILAEVKNELARFNLDAQDIQTIQYNIRPDYDYFPGRPPRLREYVTYHSLELTVRKLEDVDTIVQTLGNSGATNISGIRFTVDDPSEVQNEAREEAITQAKEKAEQLARLSGAKLGKLISINESTPSHDYSVPRLLDGYGGGGAEVGLEEGSIEFTSAVTLTYTLS